MFNICLFYFQELLPKTPEIIVPEIGINITIEYYVYDLILVKTLIQRSRYCMQEISLECNDSSLDLGDQAGNWYGWQDFNDVKHSNWPGNDDQGRVNTYILLYFQLYIMLGYSHF